MRWFPSLSTLIDQLGPIEREVLGWDQEVLDEIVCPSTDNGQCLLSDRRDLQQHQLRHATSYRADHQAMRPRALTSVDRRE